MLGSQFVWYFVHITALKLFLHVFDALGLAARYYSDSVTEMLFNLRLLSFSTILHNTSITFNRCRSNYSYTLWCNFEVSRFGLFVLAYAMHDRVH